MSGLAGPLSDVDVVVGVVGAVDEGVVEVDDDVAGEDIGEDVVHELRRGWGIGESERTTLNSREPYLVRKAVL